uniref:Uncharacterized protein n=1 Tax=Eutreptiella gymnastica TaxID=73025 RepID=A0A7S4GCI9_9EUGL
MHNMLRGHQWLPPPPSHRGLQAAHSAIRCPVGENKALRFSFFFFAFIIIMWRVFIKWAQQPQGPGGCVGPYMSGHTTVPIPCNPLPFASSALGHYIGIPLCLAGTPDHYGVGHHPTQHKAHRPLQQT